MRAIVYDQYGPPNVLVLKDVARPVPADDAVLVRVHATVVTPSDCAFRKAEPFVVRLYTGLTRPKHPILGTVLAGVVEAVGGAVTRFKPGDRVFGASNTTFGCYADYVAVPESGILTTMPPGISFAEVAAISEGFLTAIPFLRDHGEIATGKTLLVNGASGNIGVNAIQIAKHFGAHVTGVCSTAHVDLVRSLGADDVIDYTKEDFTRSGRSWDIVLDAVAKSSFARCRPVLAPGGIYLITAVSPSVLFGVLASHLSGGGKKMRNAATGLRKAADQVADLEILKRLYAAGALRGVVDHRYPLEKTAEAHVYVETGHKAGSVVIAVVDGA